MNAMKKSFATLLLSLFSMLLFSQQRVDIHLSSDSLLIGQVLEVRLEVERSLPDQWTAIAPLDTAWTVLSNQIDTAAWEKNRKYHQQMRLTRFDSGFHLLAFTPLVINGDSLRVSASYVYVGLPPKGEIELTDIHDPYAAPFNWPLYVALPLGIALLLALVIYFLRRWKKRESQAPVYDRAAPVDPRKEALRLLQKYADEKLWQSELKTYYTHITDVFRMYVEATYGLRAKEMTGNELAEQLHHLHLQAQDAQSLRNFLLAADFAKYAEKGETGRDLPGEIDLLQHLIQQYPPSVDPNTQTDIPSS
jgi:hypothetical protein